MTKNSTFLVALFVLATLNITAQPNTDVRINYQPGIEQSRVKTDVAFNGWVYAAHSTFDSLTNEGGIVVRLSKDNGLTWSTLTSYKGLNTVYNAFEFVVAGTDTANIKLFLAGVDFNTATAVNKVFIDKYDARTGTWIGNGLNISYGTRPVYDVAIATDYTAPAVGASPYSVALAYSVYNSSNDSIIYIVSTDGGSTFQTQQTAAFTGFYMRRLDMAYGRSSSASNGRYFIAYERMPNSNSTKGNIYFTRSTSTIDGPFIPPINLDSVSSSMAGLCSNPQIAVSVLSTTDNDSGSVTALVVVERDYGGIGNDFDFLGFCNMRAHYTDFWSRYDIDNSGAHCKYPSISYSTSDTSFLATVLDSSGQSTTLYKNSLNLSQGINNWTKLKVNYNDGGVLKATWPRVVAHPTNGKALLAWSKYENNRNTSYFEADGVTFPAYNTATADTLCQGETVVFNGQTISASGTYADTLQAQNAIDSIITFTVLVQNCTGIEQLSSQTIRVFPNPFNHVLHVAVISEEEADMQLSVSDVSGRIIYDASHHIETGTARITIPASDSWSGGLYVLNITSASGKRSVLLTKE